jgi:predicted ATP-dependent Lon-type protease
LAFQVKGGLPVPTYVLEYLLGNIAPAIMKWSLTKDSKR